MRGIGVEKKLHIGKVGLLRLVVSLISTFRN